MIDLHTHTTASDGTDSPFALVKKALATGVTTLGITDHDSTAGWAEAITAIQPQIQLVLGAEVSCLTTDGISVHMLGLLFDGEDEPIQQMLSDSRDTRLPRMRKMVALLQADGFDISLEDVYQAAPDQATIGRPHLADALVAKKIVATRDEAFAVAKDVGYPLVIRPSFVLGGRAMEIIRDDAQLERYIREAVQVSGNNPVLLDSYLSGAIEVDVDAICDGEQVYIAGIMEHIEEADGRPCLVGLQVTDEVPFEVGR